MFLFSASSILPSKRVLPTPSYSMIHWKTSMIALSILCSLSCIHCKLWTTLFYITFFGISVWNLQLLVHISFACCPISGLSHFEIFSIFLNVCYLHILRKSSIFKGIQCDVENNILYFTEYWQIHTHIHVQTTKSHQSSDASKITTGLTQSKSLKEH